MVSLRIIFWRLNNYEESIENWYYGNDWIYAVCIWRTERILPSMA
nr:MAG TPA: hypothetical protein [Caudoviricetes sp.]DAW17614.1 MAG TPA: hypothetical protein [Caudoviricetes sp.]